MNRVSMVSPLSFYQYRCRRNGEDIKILLIGRSAQPCGISQLLAIPENSFRTDRRKDFEIAELVTGLKWPTMDPKSSRSRSGPTRSTSRYATYS